LYGYFLFFGTVLAHKKLYLGSASGVSTGGEVYTVGGDGGSNSCDSGGGG
jgi:hypothetical protein